LKTIALLLALAAPPGGAASASPVPPAQPAAEIDASAFSHALRVTVPASPDGVARLALPAAVVAVAQADLADLRVVDEGSRQWPYILREEAAHEDVDLRVEVQRLEPGRSRYALALPVAPVPVDAVTLQIDREFYDRGYRLVGEPPGSGLGRTETLATGRLARPAGGPASLVIAFPRARVAKLALFVDDGDEAPLPIGAAKAGLPVAELRLVAPAGVYTLLVGNAEAHAPRYELARVRERVVEAAGVACEVGALEANPKYRTLARREEGDQGGMAQRALWAVMALAVVGLGALTLRLSRKEQGGAPKGEGE
jgi:hypothetical protein